MKPARFIRFPPGRGNVFVPLGPRRDTRAGLSLYAGCRPHVLLAQRGAWLAVAVGGAAILPGARLEWRPPMAREQWDELLSTWRRQLGEFERFALIVRRQHSRSGFALLLLQAGVPVAFVKVRDDEASLVREQRALTLLHEQPAPSVEVPTPLVLGSSGELTWLALSPMTARPHRPEPHAPVAEVIDQVRERLAALPRPPEVPTHWEPMHGDLAPWNFRRSADKRWLLDWEDAGYGPPGADALYYRLTCASVQFPVPDLTFSDEAIAYWKSALDQRREGEGDVALSTFLSMAIREHGR